MAPHSPSYLKVSNRIVELQSVIYNSLTPSKQQESSSLNLSPRIASKICDKDNQVKKSNDLGFVKNQPGDHIKHTSHIASPIIEIQNQSTCDIKENDDEGWIEVNSKRKKMTNFIVNLCTKTIILLILTGQRNSKIGTFKSVEKMGDIFLGNVDKMARRMSYL